MAGERAGGREGGERQRSEENRWRNRTALRHEGESWRGSSCVSSHTPLWAGRASQRDGGRGSERAREKREGGSLSFHLKITLSHTSLTLRARRRNKEEAELIRRCQVLLSCTFFFPLCFCTRVNWTSLQRLHRKDWEIKINKSRTEEKEKWESCSGGSFTVNLLLVGKSWICFIFLR